MPRALPAIISLAFAACGTATTSHLASSNAVSPPFTLGDLQPIVATTPVLSRDIPLRLSGMAALYANQPTDNSKPIGTCSAEINSQLLTATRHMVTANSHLDLTKCLGISGLEHYTFDQFIQTECQEVDLSSFDGEPISALANSRLMDQCVHRKDLLERVLDMKMPLPNDSGIKQLDKIFMGASDLQPCRQTTRNGKRFYADDCLYVESGATTNLIAGEATDAGTFSTLHYQDVYDLAGDHSARWHSGGHIDVTDGNWTGSVQFYGADGSPTYSMSLPGQEPMGGVVTSAGLN